MKLNPVLLLLHALCAMLLLVACGGGGEGSNPRNTIQFFNVDSTGNAIDFGDTSSTSRGVAACSSPTRGIFFLG